MENGGTRRSKLLIKLEHHKSVFGFRPTHNPKVAGSNPAPATTFLRVSPLLTSRSSMRYRLVHILWGLLL